MHGRVGLVIVIALLSPVTRAQVIPANFSFPAAGHESINGSSATGNCNSSSVTTSDGITTCTQPASSVLFDGIIPTLTGLDGDMWASELLTLRTQILTPRVDIYFDFAISTVRRVEVVLFNCPERGIGVQTLKLVPPGLSTTVTNISCYSLVRACLSLGSSTLSGTHTLELHPDPSSMVEWVYLAEVTFYGGGSTCPPDTIITALGITETTSDERQTTNSAANGVPTHSSASPSSTEVPTDTTALSLLSTAATTGISSPPSSSTIIIVISVCCVLLLLLLVCLLAAVLILWRCHHAKHHKHQAPWSYQ